MIMMMVACCYWYMGGHKYECDGLVRTPWSLPWPLVWQQLQSATDGIRWITRMVMIQLADRLDMGSNSAEIIDMTLGPDKPKMSESLCCMVSRHKGEGGWKGQPKAHHHHVEWVHEMSDDCCSTTHMSIVIVVSITVMLTSWWQPWFPNWPHPVTEVMLSSYLETEGGFAHVAQLTVMREAGKQGRMVAGRLWCHHQHRVHSKYVCKCVHKKFLMYIVNVLKLCM